MLSGQDIVKRFPLSALDRAHLAEIINAALKEARASGFDSGYAEGLRR